MLEKRQAVDFFSDRIDDSVLIQAIKSVGIDQTLLDEINKIYLQKFENSECPKKGRHKIICEQVNYPKDEPVMSRDDPIYYKCEKCGISYWWKYLD